MAKNKKYIVYNKSKRYEKLMTMTHITLTLPDETIQALKVSSERVGEEIRIAAAMKLYEIGKLSSGSAAQLAGIPRVEFLSLLGNYGVSTFRQTEEELLDEFNNA